MCGESRFTSERGSACWPVRLKSGPLHRERSDRGQRPHVRGHRGARAQGCPGPLAPLPGGGL